MTATIKSGLLAGNPIHNATHPREGWIYCSACCEQAGPERVAAVQARIEALAAAER